MSIFTYDDYRLWLNEWLKSQPKKGHGLAQKLARHLRVSTVLVSQVLRGQRELQAEHAFELSRFIGLTQLETEYFLLLVQYSRAGTEIYREFLSGRLQSIRRSAGELKERVQKDIELSEEGKAKFYSHWSYSAIRLLTDIPEFHSPMAIAAHLSLSTEWVSRALDFLVQSGLCKQDKDGYKMATQNTHLESDSPWILTRQLQWRQKALQRMETPSKECLFYTGPMVISNADREWVREELIEVIKRVVERARSSSSENLSCMNIDWFNLVKPLP